jgi:hypothetical protein
MLSTFYYSCNGEIWLVSFPKWVEQVLDEFPNVMLEELSDDLPPKRQVDHAIEVMLGMAPPAKAPY